MAQLQLDGDDLVLHLSTAEKVESTHGDLRVPRSAVQAVEVVDDAHPKGFAFKVGTRIPGVIEVATLHTNGKKLFAAVHRDTPRGVRVRLADTSWDEWIVGCENPEAVVAQLSLPG